MRTIGKEELEIIIKMHSKWAIGDIEGKRANLSDAILIGANLSDAILRDADLRGADLSGADLSGADLSDAIFRGASLRGASLRGADLSGANIHWPIACPEQGSFIGFKKAGGYIVELEVTYDALRSSATTRKCRCSKAKVISITNYDGADSGVSEVASNRDRSFMYKLGEIVEVNNFDTNRWNECSTGIHFFITRQEAVDY